MKKNLISVLILALLVVNVVLTAIMMFSTMGAVKKTSALVDNIAAVLSLELEPGAVEEDTTVQISDMVSHDIPDSLTIPLRRGADDKDHYYIVSVSLMMNSKNADYESYGPSVEGGSQDSLFKSIIIEVIGSHTIDEAKANPEGMREEILLKIQEAYGGSTFIYKVAFSGIMFQ
ncbi:MAG: flagellar basal body-associated FliL family protein [Lachnospiraceae bacterium]|nr:flagellar basal body-associated FliL family protein [Lachnospiraceae bacterium]